eukprot:8782782-Lingulodinium_polyedra.AAC.1
MEAAERHDRGIGHPGHQRQDAAGSEPSLSSQRPPAAPEGPAPWERGPAATAPTGCAASSAPVP